MSVEESEDLVVHEGDVFEVKRDFQGRSLRVSSFHRNFKVGQKVEFAYFAPKRNAFVLKFHESLWLIPDSERKHLKNFPLVEVVNED